MNTSVIFVIRRALVVPMGLLSLLMIALFVVCLLQGQAIAKIILLAFLIIPVLMLFVESAFRRLTLNEDGVTAYRLFRQRHLSFADVTSLETVRVRSRVFMTLAAGDDEFLIISNSYARFPELVDALIASVPKGTVTDETLQLAEQPSFRQSDIFMVWFAVITLVYVLLAQFKG